MTTQQRLTWDQFTDLCHGDSDSCSRDMAVFDTLSDKDGTIDELLETSSVTVTIGGEKYILSLVVDKEVTTCG